MMPLELFARPALTQAGASAYQVGTAFNGLSGNANDKAQTAEDAHCSEFRGLFS
jgi:hypothetical protein